MLMLLTKKFCGTCGRKLHSLVIPADELFIRVLPDYEVKLGDKYDKLTGAQQFGIKYVCPNKSVFNRCEEYIDANSLHIINK